MRSISSHYTSYSNDGIHLVALYKLSSSKHQFKTTWYCVDDDILIAYAMLYKRITGTLKKGTCDFIVPFTNYDSYTQTRSTGYGFKILVGKIMQSACHRTPAYLDTRSMYLSIS